MKNQLLKKDEIMAYYISLYNNSEIETIEHILDSFIENNIELNDQTIIDLVNIFQNYKLYCGKIKYQFKLEHLDSFGKAACLIYIINDLFSSFYKNAKTNIAITAAYKMIKDSDYAKAKTNLLKIQLTSDDSLLENNIKLICKYYSLLTEQLTKDEFLSIVAPTPKQKLKRFFQRKNNG